jgi:transposase InsO family protein
MANANYDTKELCRVFGLNSSTYYAQVNEKPLCEQKKKMLEIIEQTALETKFSYGKRRMQQQLKLAGFNIGIYQTATLMKTAKVVAIKPKKKHHYPNGGLSDTKIENILNREFKQPKANTHWVGDITYIRHHQDFSYLACVLDLGTKEIVGWALSKHPNAELAKAALRNAISRKNPNTRQLLFHSDQGVQYTANMFAVYCTPWSE